MNTLARSETRPFPMPADVSAGLARSVTRAATAAVLSRIRSPHEDRAPKVAAEAWPSDKYAQQILTKATAPATTTTAGWAAELTAITAVDAFLASLVPSAASRLFSAGLQLPLTGTAAIKVPYAATTPSIAPSVVAEGAPIPVRQAAFTTVQLGPTKKLAVITAMTNEIADHSTPSAERIIRQMLIEAASRQLDATVFTTGAGGLLNGVTPLTATAGGGAAALLGDIALLVGALTTAGATQAMLFMHPTKAAIAPIYAPGFALEIVPCPALAPATVVAVDPAGVVSGTTGQPRIDTGSETVLHFEDTTPLQIATGTQGSAVVATPTRSMFQTDSFSLRLLLDFAFVARPGYVQFVPSVTW